MHLLTFPGEVILGCLVKLDCSLRGMRYQPETDCKDDQSGRIQQPVMPACVERGRQQFSMIKQSDQKIKNALNIVREHHLPHVVLALLD